MKIIQNKSRPILRSFRVNLEKGTYKNNYQNKKLGRIGQKYGGKKEEIKFSYSKMIKELDIHEDNILDDRNGNLEVRLGEYGDMYYLKYAQDLEEELESTKGIEFITARGDDAPNAVIFNRNFDSSKLSKTAKEYLRILTSESFGDDIY